MKRAKPVFLLKARAKLYRQLKRREAEKLCNPPLFEHNIAAQAYIGGAQWFQYVPNASGFRGWRIYEY